MTWCDQIEVRTNAADMTTVWKHLKRSEKNDKSLQAESFMNLLLSTQRSTLPVLRVSTKIKAEKKQQLPTSINVSIVILLLFFKIQ